jgi:hypothetical protein
MDRDRERDRDRDQKTLYALAKVTPTSYARELQKLRPSATCRDCTQCFIHPADRGIVVCALSRVPLQLLHVKVQVPPAQDPGAVVITGKFEFDRLRTARLIHMSVAAKKTHDLTTRAHRFVPLDLMPVVFGFLHFKFLFAVCYAVCREWHGQKARWRLKRWCWSADDNDNVTRAAVLSLHDAHVNHCVETASVDGWLWAARLFFECPLPNLLRLTVGASFRIWLAPWLQSLARSSPKLRTLHLPPVSREVLRACHHQPCTRELGGSSY